MAKAREGVVDELELILSYLLLTKFTFIFKLCSRNSPVLRSIGSEAHT